MTERYAEFTEIIAEPGRGKTKTLLDILGLKLNNGERCLVILPDQSEPAWYGYPTIEADSLEDLEDKFDPNFKGVLCLLYEEKETFPFLYNLLKKGKLSDLNLVLDDPNYVQGKPERELKNILARKRQYCIDIFSNAHDYDQVPASFFPYITVFGIGSIGSAIVNRKKVLGGNYEIHEKIRQEVTRIADVEKGTPNYYLFHFFRRDGTPL